MPFTVRNQCQTSRGFTNQTGANYTGHLTVGMATVVDLKAMQAETFEEFDVHPIGLAVFQLDNNGTARALLKAWPLSA